MEKDKNICIVVSGDTRHELRSLNGCVDLIVTSPPYADARRRHYDSITPKVYPDWFASFHEVLWNALKPRGSFILNIKDKVVDGVKCHYVWKTVEKLEELGWCCIDDYVWCKPNPMPGYWPTRLRDGWEYCFHFAKSKQPYMNQDAVRIPVGEWARSRLAKLGQGDQKRHDSENHSGFGRNLSKWIGQKTVLPSNVLNIPLVGKNKGHPAVFPVELPTFFIKLLSPEGGFVLDPFCGSGSTAIAALSLGRDCLLVDNNRHYCAVARERISKEVKEEGSTVSILDHLEKEEIVHDYNIEDEQLLLKLKEKHTVYEVNTSA